MYISEFGTENPTARHVQNNWLQYMRWLRVGLHKNVCNFDTMPWAGEVFRRKQQMGWGAGREGRLDSITSQCSRSIKFCIKYIIRNSYNDKLRLTVNVRTYNALRFISFPYSRPQSHCFAMFLCGFFGGPFFCLFRWAAVVWLVSVLVYDTKRWANTILWCCREQ